MHPKPLEAIVAEGSDENTFTHAVHGLMGKF